MFAAGNSGSSNDEHIFTPGNVDIDNALTVTATIDRDALPKFSCFGKRTVHVAAPGVGIESTVPGNEFMMMTGTSQAAPYVSRVTSLIIQENKELTSREVKRIIMETVDKKSFLIGKVTSEGIVNPDRAIFAARLSASIDLSDAISKSISEVAEIK